MGSAGCPRHPSRGARRNWVVMRIWVVHSSGLVDTARGAGGEAPFQTNMRLHHAAPRGRGGGRRVPYPTRFLLRGPLNSLVDQESRSRGIHSRFQPSRARPPRRFASVGRLAMASRGFTSGSRWMGSVDDWPMAKPEAKSNRRYPPAEGR
jgi:hypothetical protein